MISDDDCYLDIDIESDSVVDSEFRVHATINTGGSAFFSQLRGFQMRGPRSAYNKLSQAEKRAQHNALERKRRDVIKDAFTTLRNSVPNLQGKKVATRAQTLKKASKYIQLMMENRNAYPRVDDLRRQNAIMEAQIRKLEKKTRKHMHPYELDIDSLDCEETTQGVARLTLLDVDVERD